MSSVSKLEPQVPLSSASQKKIILVGQPNVGKSALFGKITNHYVTVSNYPGTTVDYYKASVSVNQKTVEMIDTPGMHGLDSLSDDERVSRDILLTETDGKVFQVGDLKNLNRSLFISLQLIELGLPFLLILNMKDEAKKLGVELNEQKLSELLERPVLTTSAVTGEGINEAKNFILTPFSEITSKTVPVVYPTDIEEAIQKISALIENKNLKARGISLMLLGQPSNFSDLIKLFNLEKNAEQIQNLITDLNKKTDQPLNLRITKQRYLTALQIEKKVLGENNTPSKGSTFASKLGQACLHPVYGAFILMFVLFAAYEFVGVFGAGYLVDKFENSFFGEILSPKITAFLTAIFPVNAFFDLLKSFLVGEYGVITMGLSYGLAIILPIVSTFFIAFSIMEDSGYLPRLAYLMNRLFKRMGLNGKAVLPMVLGLGCDTMATLTARIMETKKEKILVTLLLALGVPCSAQLGVILGLFGQIPLWAGFVWLGVVVMVIFIVGWSASRLLPGQNSYFVMEMPPMRWPRLKNVLTKTLARIEWYIKEAVPLFLFATAVLFILDRLGLLKIIQKMGEPLVVGFLDLPIQASEAFLIGFLRRDFGATRFFDMYMDGKMDTIQVLVSMIVITLFIPCVANVLIIIKEFGIRTALKMAFFIFPFAFLVGGIVNKILR